MSSYLLTYILLLFALHQSIDCSYRYAGCYTQVFYETYFTSSFMEPTLCFRLCDTPIIYLQRTICRCSGGGLMHHNRQGDGLCTIPCTQPVDRSIQSANTCGGSMTYSAYVQENFYTLHGHLFDYRIEFSSCELWKTNDVYETYEVNFNQNITRSSLNRLERCAAACLDQNAITKSIAFNSNETKCLCITPLKPNQIFGRTHYVTLLSNSSCDRYCNNTYEGSKINHPYQCGSKTNPQIWAIYDLNGSCPLNYIYIQELKKCIYTYKNFWNSCTPPSINYVYDGSLPWKNFLNVISKLQLNSSIVSVDFDDDVVIDNSWKCSFSSSTSSTSETWRTYYSRSRSTLYSWNTNTRFILDNGCLRESSYSSYSHRYANRLCVADAINRYSSMENDNGSYITAINPKVKYCPTNWFDLNGRCYQISEERKTFDQAKTSCINISSSNSDGNNNNNNNKQNIWLIDINGNVYSGEELNQSPRGEIVNYISQWQARLGFFLLDTDPDHDSTSSSSSTSNIDSLFYDESLISSDENSTIDQEHNSINEFLAISSNEQNDNNTCAIITRTTSEEEEKPIIQSLETTNCSTPRHVLCETNTLIVQNFQKACLEKPKSFDLPALISHDLTHEFCLSVCQELQTKLAILHINKCYCLNGAFSNSMNITVQFPERQQDTCGDACPGNSHELCGNEKTIVAFQILDSRRTFTYVRTPPEPFPNYIYDSCMLLTSLNQSTFYQFQIVDRENLHPRYCLSLCTKYQQKYALINQDRCLCTNNPIKNDVDYINIVSTQNCSQLCPGNYFYSCGSSNNSMIYSMYVLQPKCRHGFEVAENDQQCVYSHFSVKVNTLQSAQQYCQSIGSTLAKVNEIIEIQDILPDSVLYTRLMQQLLLVYKFKYINDTRLYWIDRTNDPPNPNTISERLIKQCSNMSEIIDRNCIVIQYVSNENQAHERCIIESNDCSSKTAMPVCVDQHLDNQTTLVPSINSTNSEDVSTNVTIEYFCDEQYDFLDDYCYRIIFHEIDWNKAKQECQFDDAMIFIPEKSIALQYIKSLYQRRKQYSSTGYVHVGVFYNLTNRTVIQTNLFNHQSTIPDSNAIYDLCEKTFQERYNALMASTSLTMTEKNRLKTQQMGCGYIDLISNTVPTIRCDEIPCNRSATVICQKLPNMKTQLIDAKRQYSIQSTTKTITNPSTQLSSSTKKTNQVTSSTSILNDTEDYPAGAQENIKSFGRDFAPIFYILTILSSVIILGAITTLCQRRRRCFRSSYRHNGSLTYSQLTSANEFDLN